MYNLLLVSSDKEERYTYLKGLREAQNPKTLIFLAPWSNDKTPVRCHKSAVAD